MINHILNGIAVFAFVFLTAYVAMATINLLITLIRKK